MKIIFLDIDGVVNTSNHIEWRFSRPKGERGSQQDWCGQACENINTLAKKAGGEVNIVVSSTWRLSHSLAELHGICRNNGIEVPVIDRTPAMHEVQAKVVAPNGEPADWTKRGTEIYQWIQDTGEERIDSYVILDDDEDMLPSQENNFVRCHHSDGFANFDKLEKAIKILSQ